MGRCARARAREEEKKKPKQMARLISYSYRELMDDASFCPSPPRATK